jgi:hypothetical protein
MKLHEALRIIRRSGMSITEARSFDRTKKEAAARRLIDAFPDFTYERSKKPLTDEEKRKADEAAAPFTVNDVAGWANRRGKDLFDRKERETLYYLSNAHYEKRLNDGREAERRRYNQNIYNRYKKCMDIWPEYKRNVVDKLIANGYSVVKIDYADHFGDFCDLMRDLENALPGYEPMDGSKIPYRITMRVENSVDSFRFETPIMIDHVSLGNSDPIQILAKNSNGKAKACAALERYRLENRNTWDIPMDIFMPAAIEFANADDFLDDEESAAVKKSADANDAWQAGASEFYRTAKYQGD